MDFAFRNTNELDNFLINTVSVVNFTFSTIILNEMRAHTHLSDINVPGIYLPTIVNLEA